RPVLRRNSRCIAEVSAVVKLHDANVSEFFGRQPLEGDVDLPGHRTDRSRLIERVPPKVAKQTAKSAFAIRQKNRRDVEHSDICLPLRFNECRDRLPRIDW